MDWNFNGQIRLMRSIEWPVFWTLANCWAWCHQCVYRWFSVVLGAVGRAVQTVYQCVTDSACRRWNSVRAHRYYVSFFRWRSHFFRWRDSFEVTEPTGGGGGARTRTGIWSPTWVSFAMCSWRILRHSFLLHPETCETEIRNLDLPNLFHVTSPFLPAPCHPVSFLIPFISFGMYLSVSRVLGLLVCANGAPIFYDLVGLHYILDMGSHLYF